MNIFIYLKLSIAGLKFLTLILLELKLINPCHYTVCWPTVFYIDFPKNDNGQVQKWKVDYSI